jgi:hypothetical protein
LLKRNPYLRWVAAQRFTIETRGCDADDGEGMTIQHEGCADHLGVGAVFLLPGAIAEHRCGQGRALVIGRHQRPAGKGLNAEGGKVVSGDELAPQRLGQAIDFTAPHAEL